VAADAPKPPRLLFLCVANSARSQIAEGIARRILGPDALIQSAGSLPSSVNRMAVRVMAEIGIDISQQRSKAVASIRAEDVDTVVTLCAEEVCPVFLGKASRLHWPLPDPARVTGSEAARLASFRAVRDELLRRIQLLAREA
jgi:thioredoxin type arsenate reductase